MKQKKKQRYSSMKEEHGKISLERVTLDQIRLLLAEREHIL
jgi:hypothetical protein